MNGIPGILRMNAKPTRDAEQAARVANADRCYVRGLVEGCGAAFAALSVNLPLDEALAAFQRGWQQQRDKEASK